MHFDKLISPNQAYYFYKEAKKRQESCFNDSYKYDYFLTTGSFPYVPLYSLADASVPTTSVEYKIYYSEIIEGFEKYLNLRFGNLLNQDWYGRTLHFFNNYIYDLIEFLEFLPDTTQLILLPKDRKSDIIFLRVNLQNLIFEKNELKIFYPNDAYNKFTTNLQEDNWRALNDENLDQFLNSHFRPIPARQILAAVFCYINERIYIKEKIRSQAIKLIDWKHNQLNDFEGIDTNHFFYDDRFLDIYNFYSKNKLSCIQLLPYKNPLN